jgi:FkbM family methyltransferase
MGRIAAAFALLSEMRERLVNIETKINALGGFGFSGHRDQRYGHLTYSQHGEDLVFVAMFEALGIDRPTYLDIGAHHPINCSNTALLYSRGSRGINVDANPDLMDEFYKSRADEINLNVGVSSKAGTLTFYRIDKHSGRNTFSKEAAEAFVAANPQFSITDKLQIEVVTLDSIIATHCAGKCPDLLSVDAEGFDFDILANASFLTRPKILCVETSSAAGQAGDKLTKMLSTRGFRKLLQMGENGIFVPIDTSI